MADRFDFENVGVTKPIPAKQSGVADPNLAVNANFRYLVCADCDRGPVGIMYDMKHSYVTHGKVAYK